MSVRVARIVSIFVIVSLGLAARLPTDELSQEDISKRFSFVSKSLNSTFGIAERQTRDVHRDLAHIQPWISSVGAAAAIGDVDGDLMPDDTCYVDTRINRVVVAPLLDDEYAPFLPELSDPNSLRSNVAPMGCLISDLDEDGLPDLLVYYWGQTPTAFLRVDQGPATLTQYPGSESYDAVHLISNERWFSNAASFADVDGDGHADLLIGNYFCDGGRILDSETDAPVCPRPVMQDSMSRAFNGGGLRVLLWEEAERGAHPSVTYRDLRGLFTEDVGQGWTLGLGAYDLNSDALPDIYVANDFGPDRLLLNCSKSVESFGSSREQLGCYPLEGPVAFRLLEGQRDLTIPRSKVLGRDSFKGMGVDFGDIDSDGLVDIYVSNITETWALQESQFAFVADGSELDASIVQRGIAPFRDESESLGLSRSGWAWDAKLVDFDNDGQVEALQALGFVRGRSADSGLVWRKSCWVMLQELAMANDNLLKHAGSWFHMEHDETGVGCDLSGNSTRNAFFVRGATGRFVDVGPLLDHVYYGAPSPTRGLAIGDADLDGRLDYIEANQYSAPTFHHNTSLSGRTNDYISFSPRILVGRQEQGTGSLVSISEANQLRTRPALGALAIVRLSDERQFIVQVDGGNGHSGKRSPDVHIGIGASKRRVTVDLELHWRGKSGERQTAELHAIPISQHFVVLLEE